MSSTSSSSSISNTSSGGNILRITGMASGLDVDATVKKLMTAEQFKIDSANQDKQALQWKQSSYQDIISKVKDLQNSFFNVGSSDTNILSSANYAAFDVSGDLSTAGKVTAGVGAQVGNYTLRVTNIAAAAGYTTTLTPASGLTLTSKLSAITGGVSPIDSSGSTNMTQSLNLVLNVNGGTSNSANGGSQVKITLDNTGGTSTVKDLVNAINSQGGGVVKASFSELTQKFSLTTVATGLSQTISIDNTAITGTSTGLLNMLDSTGATVTGRNANFTVTPPGETVGTNVTSVATNNFTIDGINYNLTGPTTTDATFGVTQDSQKVYDKFKSFLDKYNTLVDTINTKVTETKDRSYTPLSDAQKSSMTADQITAWNTKAQVGLLNGDANLKKMLNDLQSAFSTPVNGVGLSLGSYGSKSFGLDTSADVTKPREITIVDPAKLKATIAANPDQFLKMFTNVSSAAYVFQGTAVSSNNASPVLNTSALSTIGSGTISNSSTLKINYGNSKSFNVDLSKLSGTPTISDIVTAISASSSGAVTASFSDTTHSFKLSTNISGATATIDASSSSDFTQMLGSLTSVSQLGENGIFSRIQNIVQNNVGKTGTSLNSAILTQYANSQDDFSTYGGGSLNTLADQMYQKDNLIKLLNTKFTTDQTSYYNKFSKLETAMTTLNSQSSTLTSMLNGG